MNVNFKLQLLLEIGIFKVQGFQRGFRLRLWRIGEVEGGGEEMRGGWVAGEVGS